MKKLFIIMFIFVSGVSFLFAGTEAAPDTVIAKGVYVLGSNDSQNDAKQFALLDAKRRAIEQLGTYLSSTTTVENYQLTNDEITTYTAGLMRTNILQEKLESEGEFQKMTVTIEAIVDPQEVQENLANFKQEDRENDLPDLQQNFLRMKQKMDSLKMEPSGYNSARLREYLRNTKRLELLTQIVFESRKAKPDLARMKALTGEWSEKYPGAGFVAGYQGIALAKHGRKRLARPMLLKGIRAIEHSRKLAGEKLTPKMLQLMAAQEAQFKRYLK